MNSSIKKKRYRDFRDMLISILESLSVSGSSTGTNITRLMYTTGSAWTDLLKLLKFLVDREMISKKVLPGMNLSSKRNHTVFFITPKGTKFLYLYKELIEQYLSSPRLSNNGLMINTIILP